MARQDRDSQYGGGGGSYSSSSNQSGRGQSYGGNGNSSILSNVIKFITSGGITGAIIRGITSGVKNQKNLKQAKIDDALGGEMLTREKTNFTSGGGEGNNSNVAIPLIKNSLTTTTGIAPTAAEVSQSKAADAYDSRKTKARGRSMTILTKPTGLKDDTLTLGQKSLLGS
mgnify:CR=1 FL=1